MPPLTTIRDVAIIILAVQSIFLGLVLIALTVQIVFLVHLVRKETAPILKSARETVEAVRVTASAVKVPARATAAVGMLGKLYRLLRRRRD